MGKAKEKILDACQEAKDKFLATISEYITQKNDLLCTPIEPQNRTAEHVRGLLDRRTEELNPQAQDIARQTEAFPKEIKKMEDELKYQQNFLEYAKIGKIDFDDCTDEKISEKKIEVGKLNFDEAHFESKRKAIIDGKKNVDEDLKNIETILKCQKNLIDIITLPGLPSSNDISVNKLVSSCNAETQELQTRVKSLEKKNEKDNTNKGKI